MFKIYEAPTADLREARPATQITAEELDDFLHNLHTKEGLAVTYGEPLPLPAEWFLPWSAKAGYLPSDKNPMAQVEPFPEDNAPKDCMSEAELARFIDKASEYRTPFGRWPAGPDRPDWGEALNGLRLTGRKSSGVTMPS